MKKITKIVTSSLFFVMFFCFFSSVFGSTTLYSNTYLGIPNFNTYINFDSTQTFSTTQRVGNAWFLDNYEISIRNANLTVTSLFEQPTELGLQIDGLSDTHSTLTFDVQDYGFTAAPTEVDVTGDIIQYNIDYAGNILTLTTDHNDANPVSYTIKWATTSSSTGGTSPTTPQIEPPTETPNETPTDTTPQPETPETPTHPTTNPETPIIILLIGIIAIASIIGASISKNKNRTINQKYQNRKNRKSKRPNYDRRPY